MASVTLGRSPPVPHAMLLSQFEIAFSGLLGAVTLDSSGPSLPRCLGLLESSNDAFGDLEATLRTRMERLYGLLQDADLSNTNN